jgi:hypothetical protein
MQARKRCKWKGCKEPRAKGQGKWYCEEHSEEARIAREESRSRRQEMRHRRQPVVIEPEQDQAHVMAVRMLAGKA